MEKILLYGRRYRKPTQEEINVNISNGSYGLGTHATIYKDLHDILRYTIYGIRNCFCDDSRYNTFNSIDEAKNHLVEKYGGKWKWSNKYI